MTTTRDELRDHLVAALEAAPELPRENREYLADVFLDELDARFQLVPRSQSVNRTSASAGTGRDFLPTLPAWLLVFAAILLLPILLWSAFAVVHPPILLLILLIWLVFRSQGRRRWRNSHYRRSF